jgi:hypothetical protein
MKLLPLIETAYLPQEKLNDVTNYLSEKYAGKIIEGQVLKFEVTNVSNASSWGTIIFSVEPLPSQVVIKEVHHMEWVLQKDGQTILYDNDGQLIYFKSRMRTRQSALKELEDKLLKHELHHLTKKFKQVGRALSCVIIVVGT